MVVLRVLLLTVVLLTFGIGCESKFVESSPHSITIDGVTLEDRLFEKAAVDQRISQIQEGANQLKRIIELFRKIKSANSSYDAYTPIDFLLDLNQELKSKIPEMGNGKLVRKGKIKLPISALSEECQTIEALLESSTLTAEDVANAIENSEPLGERLTYSLKSCASNDEYLEVLRADWIGPELKISFNGPQAEKLFKDILFTEIQKDSICKIIHDDKAILDSIVCESLAVPLSESEIADVKVLKYSNSDLNRFEAYAEILENGARKAIFEIEVSADGKVKSELNKITDQ